LAGDSEPCGFDELGMPANLGTWNNLASIVFYLIVQ
jgi:hypothetical protein